MIGWHHQYGPIFSFTLLGRTCVAISSPTYLRVMLQSKIKHVKKDVAFTYKPFLPILGTGIVTSEGKRWMKQRLNISSALRFDVLDDIPRITLGAVQHLCHKLDRAAEANESVELGAELRHLTLQVISNAFFSLSAEESDTTFAQMYLPIVEEGNKRVWHPERAFCFFLPFFWSHRQNCAKLDKYVSQLIRDRWELRKKEKLMNVSQKRNIDVLDRVFAKHEHEEGFWSEETVRQLRDEMKTFMLAGHETSAAMMTWAIYELIKNDELTEKVCEDNILWLSTHFDCNSTFLRNVLFSVCQVTNEGKSIFGDNFDWCAKGVDESKLPSRDELSKLNLSEACLKVRKKHKRIFYRMYFRFTLVHSHFANVIWPLTPLHKQFIRRLYVSTLLCLQWVELLLRIQRSGHTLCQRVQHSLSAYKVYIKTPIFGPIP